jgi:glycosyltransferase involved in cell wall biosynthesis
MPPFVSFVIPTYNRAGQITNAIQSALEQTDADLEVIVVDDGSTDDSASVIGRIADPRVQYFHKENGERGAARNFGIRQASGIYVYLLDSDDTVTADHVAHARGLLDQLGRPEVMYSRPRWVDVDGNAIPQLQPAACPDRPNAVLHDLLRRNILGSCLFVRRDIALLHPSIEDRRFIVGEDWYLALVLASRYPIYATKLVTRMVVTHHGQTMTTISPERCLLGRDLLTEYLEKDPVFIGQHRSALAGIRAEMTSLAALQYALVGRRRQAVFTLASAAYMAPARLMGRRTLATIKHALRPNTAHPNPALKRCG